MTANDNDEIGLIGKLRQDHEVFAAIVVYAVLSAVGYAWFAGAIGDDYLVHSQVVLFAIGAAALLFVPLLISVISKSEYELEAAEAFAAKEEARAGSGVDTD